MTTNNANATKPFQVKYAVMATIYPAYRAKDLTGPWKATPEEAVKAFGEKFAKYGALSEDSKKLFRVFLAETAPEAQAICKASTGHYYNGSTAVTSRDLRDMLNDAGFYIYSLNLGHS
jgi:hypothetical protein